MADTLEVESRTTPEHKQIEAASRALIRFQDSAAEFFKYQHVYTEAAKTKQMLLETEVEVEEKEDKIQELETAISVFTHGGSKEVSRMELEMAGMKKEMAGLRLQLEQVTEDRANMTARMGETKRLLAEQQKESARFQKELSVLKTNEKNLTTKLDRQIDANKETARRLGEAHAQLHVYVDYTANLVDLNGKTLYAFLPTHTL